MTRQSNIAYFVAVGVLAVSAALNVYLPQGTVAGMPVQELPTSRPLFALALAGIMLVFYGGLGYIGLLLGHKLGFPGVWDPGVSNRQRFVAPALVGAGFGVFLIILDQVFAGIHGLGPIPHPPFPTSLVASLAAGIGEEIIFRLFFISFWVWLISSVLLRGRAKGVVFWVVAAASAVAFTAAHTPSVVVIFGLGDMTNMPAALASIPTALMVELFVMNGVLSLIAAHYLRKAGVVAAMGVHFWTDFIWHVVWGLF